MSSFDSFDGESPKQNFSDKAADIDQELKDFLILEKQKVQYHSQISEYNDFCWDKCVDKPGVKLDSKMESCLNNCVERFIDVTMFITNRFAQLLQKTSGKF